MTSRSGYQRRPSTTTTFPNALSYSPSKAHDFCRSAVLKKSQNVSKQKTLPSFDHSKWNRQSGSRKLFLWIYTKATNSFVMCPTCQMCLTSNEIWCVENFGLLYCDIFYLLSGQLWADCGKVRHESYVKNEVEPFQNIKAWEEVQDKEASWMSIGKFSCWTIKVL
jgi:hypothetical protein